MLLPKVQDASLFISNLKSVIFQAMLVIDVETKSLYLSRTFQILAPPT